MDDQSEIVKGAGYLITILVLLSLALLVAGGALVVRHPEYGFSLLAAAVLVGILARMVQASEHHRELMEDAGGASRSGRPVQDNLVRGRRWLQHS